jgi:hypothetical protein
MMAIRLGFAALLLSSAALAQTPGIGETRPAPPSLDEQRGPVGGGTGNDPAPEVAPGKRHSTADREISRCNKLSDEPRAQCLREERAAAAGGSRRAEPATSTPPQNPR